MTAKSFVARATVVGTDPARAADLHAQARRIGLRMKAQFAASRSPADRELAKAIALRLIDAAVAETIENALGTQVGVVGVAS